LGDHTTSACAYTLDEARAVAASRHLNSRPAISTLPEARSHESGPAALTEHREKRPRGRPRLHADV